MLMIIIILWVCVITMFQLGGLLQGEVASSAEGGDQQQHNELGGDQEEKQQQS